MTAFSLRPAMLALAPLALALQGCATYSEPVAEPAAPVAQPAAPAEPVGPGLWKVVDEDTTIYLFGTIHALPETIEWYRGPIGEALAETQELVTEIPTGAAQDPAMQQMVMASAVLPADTIAARPAGRERPRHLRSRAHRAGHAARQLRPLQAVVRSDDAFGPPAGAGGLQGRGARRDEAGGTGPANARRGALETLDEQIALFDTLPTDSQTAFLMVSADSIDEIVPMMDRMVDEWLEGDADGLAALLNEGLTDPVLAEALLYARNDRWAEWIDTRMDSPGTVFVAVGAGPSRAPRRSGLPDCAGFIVDRVQCHPLPGTRTELAKPPVPCRQAM